MKNMYNNELEKVKFSDAQKANLIDKIEQKQNKKSYNFGKLAPICAVAVFMTITAYATGFFGLSNQTLDFLNPHNDEQTQMLKQGAYTVNASDKQDSGEIVVKEIIGDQHSTMIFVDFIAPDGTILDENKSYNFLETRIKYDVIEDVRGVSYYYEKIDGNPDDNVVSFVFVFTNSDKSFTGENLSVLFEDLRVADNDEILYAHYKKATEVSGLGTEYQHEDYRKAMNNQDVLDEFGVEVFGGDWKISFKADFVQYTDKIKLDGVDLKIGGYDLEMTSISVSPISIYMAIEGEIETSLTIDLDEYINFKIHYKDGTSEEISRENGHYNGGTVDQIRNIMTVYSTFTDVLDYDNIQAIEYQGNMIYID